MITIHQQLVPVHPGSPMPTIDVPVVNQPSINLASKTWKLILVYRGVQCAESVQFIKEVSKLYDKFIEAGIEVIIASSDNLRQASKFANKTHFQGTVTYDLSVNSMLQLGLSISNRVEDDTHVPYAEPALFVTNADGEVEILNKSLGTFARPVIEYLLNGIRYIKNSSFTEQGSLSQSA